MADDSGSIHSVTEGGIAGLHPETPLPPAVVAATQTGSERNTLRSSVVPFACWRAHDMRFKFDSSFVLPTIKAEIRTLKDLMDENTLPDETGQPKYKPALSVFGHADPIGSDGYNKVLSGKRAQSIYALLVRDVDLWDDLYEHPQGNDRWEPEVIEAMQSELEQPLSGNLSQTQRKGLYKDYMDHPLRITEDVINLEQIATRDAQGKWIANPSPATDAQRKVDALGVKFDTLQRIGVTMKQNKVARFLVLTCNMAKNADFGFGLAKILQTKVAGYQSLIVSQEVSFTDSAGKPAGSPIEVWLLSGDSPPANGAHDPNEPQVTDQNDRQFHEIPSGIRNFAAPGTP